MVRDAAQGYGGETEGFGLENLIWHHPSPVIQCLYHCKSQVFCPRTRSQRVGGPSHEFSKVDSSYCPLPCRSVAGSESSGLFFSGGGVNEACCFMLLLLMSRWFWATLNDLTTVHAVPWAVVPKIATSFTSGLWNVVVLCNAIMHLDIHTEVKP